MAKEGNLALCFFSAEILCSILSIRLRACRLLLNITTIKLLRLLQLVFNITLVISSLAKPFTNQMQQDRQLPEVRFLQEYFNNQTKYRNNMLTNARQHLGLGYVFIPDKNVIGIASETQQKITPQRIVSQKQQHLMKAVAIDLNQYLGTRIEMLPDVCIKKVIIGKQTYYNNKEVDLIFTSYCPQILGVDIAKIPDSIIKSGFKSLLTDMTDQIEVLDDSPIRKPEPHRKYLHIFELKHRLKYQIMMQAFQSQQNTICADYAMLAMKIAERCYKSKNILQLVLIIGVVQFDTANIKILDQQTTKQYPIQDILMHRIPHLSQLCFTSDDKHKIEKVFNKLEFDGELTSKSISRILAQYLELSKEYQNKLLHLLEVVEKKQKKKLGEGTIRMVFQNPEVIVDFLMEKSAKFVDELEIKKRFGIDEVVTWLVYFGDTENNFIYFNKAPESNFRILHVHYEKLERLHQRLKLQLKKFRFKSVDSTIVRKMMELPVIGHLIKNLKPIILEEMYRTIKITYNHQFQWHLSCDQSKFNGIIQYEISLTPAETTIVKQFEQDYKSGKLTQSYSQEIQNISMTKSVSNSKIKVLSQHKTKVQSKHKIAQGTINMHAGHQNKKVRKYVAKEQLKPKRRYVEKKE